MTSMRSEMSVVAPRPDATAFQVRRRRAAKLTNFFGESYRDLVGDILESIQKGVEDECVKGNLDREQMQVRYFPRMSLNNANNVSLFVL
jgi:hypothetical protein